MNAIFKRVSVRKYTDESVSEEQIEKLLRAAMAAPSSANQQPWEFYVSEDKEKMLQLAGVEEGRVNCAKDAAVVIVPVYRVETKRAATVMLDMSCACENILLEAVELGLGAVWLSVYPREEKMLRISQLLDIPENLKPFAMICVGHPLEEKEQQDRFDPERIHRV